MQITWTSTKHYIILMNISTMLKISLQVCSTAEYQQHKLYASLNRLSSNWFIVSNHYKCWLGKYRAPMFQVIMTNLYRGPSIDASYQISVHLGKWFQRRRFFRNQPIKNKNGLWRPCLLMDWDKMSNFIEDLP
jgi:hypothetical protein